MQVADGASDDVKIGYVMDLTPDHTSCFSGLFNEERRDTALTFLVAKQGQYDPGEGVLLTLLDHDYVAYARVPFKNPTDVPKETFVSRWCILDNYAIKHVENMYVLIVRAFRIGPHTGAIAAMGNWNMRPNYFGASFAKRVVQIASKFLIQEQQVDLDAPKVSDLTFTPPKMPKRQPSRQSSSWLPPPPPPLGEDEFEAKPSLARMTRTPVPMTTNKKRVDFLDEAEFDIGPVTCLGNPGLRLARFFGYTTPIQALVYRMSQWEFKTSTKGELRPYATASAILIGLDSIVVPLSILCFGITEQYADMLQDVTATFRDGRQIVVRLVDIQETKGYAERQLGAWGFVIKYNFDVSHPGVPPKTRVQILDAPDPTLINYSPKEIDDILSQVTITASGFRTMSMIWCPRERQDVAADVMTKLRTKILVVRAMLGTTNKGEVYLCGQGTAGDKILDPATKTFRYGVIPFKLTGPDASNTYETIKTNQAQKILSLLTLTSADVQFAMDRGPYLKTQYYTLTSIAHQADVPSGLFAGLTSLIKELTEKDWEHAGVVKNRFVMFGHFAQRMDAVHSIAQLQRWSKSHPNGIHCLCVLDASFLSEKSQQLAFNVCAYCPDKNCDPTINLFSGRRNMGINCTCSNCHTTYTAETVSCTWGGYWKITDGTGIVQVLFSHNDDNATARDEFLEAEFGMTARDIFLAAFSDAPDAAQRLNGLTKDLNMRCGRIYRFHLDCWIATNDDGRVYCANVVKIERSRPSLIFNQALLHDIQTSGAVTTVGT